MADDNFMLIFGIIIFLFVLIIAIFLLFLRAARNRQQVRLIPVYKVHCEKSRIPVLSMGRPVLRGS